MRVLENCKEVFSLVKDARRGGKTVAFIPTMGFLHQGHLSLVRKAREQAQFIVVSIFLNPTQFNNPSDLEKYPKDLEGDLKLLESETVDLVFCPKTEDIYAKDAETWVDVEALSKLHEGQFRPGHFRGVTTVVNLLFNIVSPDLAFFGEKDFQQLSLIKKMVDDLHIPIGIVGCPTVRDEDGLAMSSRNARLSKEARKIAPAIYRGLSLAKEAFAKGERVSSKLEKIFEKEIAATEDMKLEYARLIDPVTFVQKPLASANDRIVVAAWLDGVRLIDNIAL